MSHTHSHTCSHTHTASTSNKALKLTLALNASFTMIEFLGSWYTNSSAIFSDALHDLGDTLALTLAVIFSSIATRHATKKYTYGFKRMNILTSLFLQLMLLVSCILLIIEVGAHIQDHKVVKSMEMIVLAVLGVSINGYAAYKVLKKERDALSVGIRLHLLEDVLGWAAVCIGAVIIYFTGWTLIDPILSILISIYICYHAYTNIKPILHVLMQGAPSIALDYLTIFEDRLSFQEIKFWSLDHETTILTLKIKAKDAQTDIVSIKQEIRKLSMEKGIKECTIEIIE